MVTNTIPLTAAGRNEPKIRCCPSPALVARAIQSIHEETSVSTLFSEPSFELGKGFMKSTETVT